MSLAGAGYGAAKTLEEIVGERYKRQLLEEAIAEREQRFNLDERRLSEAEGQNRWERARAEKLDAERTAERTAQAESEATAKRGRANMAGVLAMGVDPQTAKKEIAYSSLQSGADVPSGVMEAMTPDVDPLKEYEGKKKIDQRYAKPDRPEKPQVFQVNGKLVDANGRVVYEGTPGAGGGPSPYATERNARTSAAVESIIGDVSGWTAGYGGLLANLPQTEARKLRGKLDTLRANIAFNELTAMREASKTGGALGSVAVRELELLQNSLGNLDQLQEPADLITELRKIGDSAERWRAAAGGDAQAAPMQPVTSRGVTPSAAQPRRMRFDRNGRPIP